MNNKEFCNYISSLSIKSILYELSSTPKPGLVDRYNSGAHTDMGFFTFLNSSSVLFPYFYKCTKAGISFEGKDYTSLLKSIRPIGIEAEKLMFKSTSGINTHKGLIFSLGIIGSVVGTLFKESNNIYFNQEDITKRVKEMTIGISKELNNIGNKEDLTYGEKLYLKYGEKGIRGEVETGFKTVRKYSLPIFTKLIKENKYHINDVLVDTLLYLIANTKDSNILGRHNLNILKYSQNQAKKAIRLGGYLKPKGKLFVKELDKEFIEKNISPGGSADLLAITIMLYTLEYGDLIECIDE